MLRALVLTYKGLSRSELCSICKVTHRELEVFLAIFKSFCFKFRQNWKIININILKFFEREIFPQSQEEVSDTYTRISEEMKAQGLSLRRLEEQTMALFLGQQFFVLKQTLCLIENFLVLYNENTKFLLHQFWKALERKGYDLVQEYNKAFEIFEIHYMPKDHHIFLVNVQLSKFFKGVLMFDSILFYLNCLDLEFSNDLVVNV